MKLIYGAMKGMGDTCTEGFLRIKLLNNKLNGNLGKEMT